MALRVRVDPSKHLIRQDRAGVVTCVTAALHPVLVGVVVGPPSSMWRTVEGACAFEVPAGVEPACMDLQSITWPLGQGTMCLTVHVRSGYLVVPTSRSGCVEFRCPSCASMFAC